MPPRGWETAWRPWPISFNPNETDNVSLQTALAASRSWSADRTTSGRGVRLGSDYFASIVRDERNWIAAGDAVDVKFNEKYRELPMDSEPGKIRQSPQMEIELSRYRLMAT